MTRNEELEEARRIRKKVVPRRLSLKRYEKALLLQLMYQCFESPFESPDEDESCDEDKNQSTNEINGMNNEDNKPNVESKKRKRKSRFELIMLTSVKNSCTLLKKGCQKMRNFTECICQLCVGSKDDIKKGRGLNDEIR